MNKKKVGIIADCTCDLPKNILSDYDIDVIYFLIETEHGVFTDTDEITAENILFHMDSGGEKSKSYPPSAEVYQKIFEKNLAKYDEVVVVTIGSGVSPSYEDAKRFAALVEGGEQRIHVFDSGHLSSGMGFFVMRAAELANEGCTAEKIISELESLKNRVSTTFIVKNAEYLYRNELVSQALERFCAVFNIHPVLEMKNGKLSVAAIYIGNYDSACKKYVRRMLKNSESIDKKCGFITYVGCSVKMLREITDEVEKQCHFDTLNVVSASATISGSCGPGTFGVLFVRND